MSMWNHRICLLSWVAVHAARSPAGDRTTQQQAKAKVESIETSATAGATIGSAASKKQPTLEQRSLANIFALHWRKDFGRLAGFIPTSPPGTRQHPAGLIEFF
jgi:hypothetical protein